MAEIGLSRQATEHLWQEYQKWEELLAEVGAARMNQPGAMGDWTFKDLVAHLNGWWFFELEQLEAELAGRPVEYPWPDEWSTEEKNMVFYQANKDRPAAAVIDDSLAFFKRVEALLSDLPEQELIAPRRFDWMRGKTLAADFLDGCLDHLYVEHMPELRPWLDQTAPVAK